MTTFNLPTSQFATALSLDPLERYFHIGTQTGEIHQVRLYRRRREVGRRQDAETTLGQVVEDGLIAVGGGGVAAQDVPVHSSNDQTTTAAAAGTIASKGVISLPNVSITTLTLSPDQTKLVSGTSSGQVHVHALPSHQHLTTINAHAGASVSHVQVVPRPADLIGHLSLGGGDAGDASHGNTSGGAGGGGLGQAKDTPFPILAIKSFERMSVANKERDEMEIHVMLGPKPDFRILDQLDESFDDEDQGNTVIDYLGIGQAFSGGTSTGHGNKASHDHQAGEIKALQAELAEVKDKLGRAQWINDRMWTAVVDRAEKEA